MVTAFQSRMRSGSRLQRRLKGEPVEVSGNGGTTWVSLGVDGEPLTALIERGEARPLPGAVDAPVPVATIRFHADDLPALNGGVGRVRYRYRPDDTGYVEREVNPAGVTPAAGGLVVEVW